MQDGGEHGTGLKFSTYMVEKKEAMNEMQYSESFRPLVSRNTSRYVCPGFLYTLIQSKV